MKNRIIEIIKELKEAELELQKEIKNFWVSNDTIFSEAVSCYREEQVGKNKTSKNNTYKSNPNTPATDETKNKKNRLE